MEVVLVGLGAVGAGYAAPLVQAGVNLQVLLDPARRQRYLDQPTVVNGERLQLNLPREADRQADLAIVTVKRAGLAAAIEQVRGWVGEGTVVLSLLNGIDSEEVLAEAFPEATVLLGMCVGLDAVREGRQVRFTSMGRIVLGEATNPGPQAARVGAVAELFNSSGIPTEIPADMVRELWWKWMINVGANQVSAILKAPYRVLQDRDSPAREVMLAAQREVIALALAKGIPLGEVDLERWLAVLDGLGPDNYTSMAQDAMAGRPTEVDSFAGTVVRLGRELEVATPVNQVLDGLLRAARF